ncbi:olfactory receptor 10A3-like [Ornithorhynchus anatinus]|uniref:Olfactory receptor n=1 Tax=Ornithorhynchus anatinus TaxID=9258 RepID=F7G4L3_ORNAN|nr:olfactory receptor 10A3-like [Ornithorhynchus anatinus]
MGRGNHSSVTEFLLLGFSKLPELQFLLFLLFLIIYLIILMGNVLIILVTTVDHILQTPMYFFLRNLSFLEICFNTVTVPKILVILSTENKSISFAGCFVQMFFFLVFGAGECFLLGAMSYDRYLAICNPLRYPILMNRHMFISLAGGSWCLGLMVAIIQTIWIFNFPFCGPNGIDHFFCDTPPVLELVCADTYLFELYALMGTILVIMVPFFLILLSYVHIISTILKMSSAEGRKKAFSTCSSHLTVVTLFYGAAILTYLRPKTGYSAESKKLLTLSYILLTPLLNPLIYSLRNSEVKEALRRTLCQKTLTSSSKEILS